MAEKQQWSIVFESSDGAAPGISLLDARRGLRLIDSAMIPRLPIDWDEACLRPYVSDLSLFCALSLKSFLLVPAMCSGLHTIHLFFMTLFSSLNLNLSTSRRWPSLRDMLRSSMNACSGYATSHIFSFLHSRLTHLPHEYSGHQSRLWLPSHALSRTQDLQAR